LICKFKINRTFLQPLINFKKTTQNKDMDLRNIKLDDLFAEIKRRAKCMTVPNKNVILVGPPGAGKGTQAPIMADELCICHRATGDLIRDNIARKTPMGIKV